MDMKKPNSQKSSIRTQMIFIVSIVFTLLIIGTVTAGIISGYAGIENTVDADLVTIRQFSAQTFSVALEQVCDEALKPAAEFDRTAALGTNAAVKYAEKMLEGSIFLECGVVTREGELRTNFELLGESVTQLDCVKRVLAGETEEPAVSSTVDFNGEMRFIAAVPCKSGAFVLTFDGSYFSDLIADKRVGETGNIFLIDGQGKMIANADQAVVSAQTNYVQMAEEDGAHRSTAELFRKMMSGETGVSKFVYNGVKNICAYGTVDGSDGWAYGVAAPESEMMSSLVTMIAALVVCSLVFLAGGIVIIAVYASKMSQPIMKMSKRMALMARGDLYTPVDNVNRTDEIGVLAYEFGGSIVSLKSYIRDLDEVLHEMSRGNMLALPQIEYDGDFSTIEKSLKQIQKSLNHTFCEIDKASNLVSDEAKQVSASSQSLADGAAEQSEVIAELMKTLAGISKASSENSATTKNAEEHAVKAGKQVKTCNERMQSAADAMTEISNSALQIEKIIGTIEDIAYQTNILALNAEIEAAAAGPAGKGFAVVADEVRNLANKSDEAAKATKQLIENSLEAVEKGSDVVKKVSGQLNETTDIVLQAVEDMKTVNAEVQREEESIREISESISQINRVVQSNTAASAQSAETSRALSVQAENLKALMSNFQCKETSEE
ncbi:MAG: methyl-accepting chemotaxis protein [Lachnospiraceae bacterium]|nr:methyl-accepting chemotaxis protein [Ruminococcus sp.]MCM1275240.1 methyl-accepting chemotaxis protein [Lachnospiraceae bacterium]